VQESNKHQALPLEWRLQQPQGWLRLAASVLYSSSVSGVTRADFTAVYKPLLCVLRSNMAHNVLLLLHVCM
jgi:hypothetical protein